MARNIPAPLPQTLRAALETRTVDQLKNLLALLPGADAQGRKADLIAAIERGLAGDGLREVWNQLDKTQRAAVADALHSSGGVFDAARFRARHGDLPSFATEKSGRELYGLKKPTRLRLFLHNLSNYDEGPGGYIPAEMMIRLRSFVPKPPPPALAALDELPEDYAREDKSYQWQEGDQGIRIITPRGQFQMPRQKPEVILTTVRIPLQRRDTERDAAAEVMTVLRLIDRGKLPVSDKTLLPGAAALRELNPLLSQGDFYPPEAKAPEGFDEIGSIKAHAWPVLVQAGGLAELSGKKLALTKAGREALSKSSAEVLKHLWARWLKTAKFDEFQRVNAIKGQTGKGKTKMTAVSGRRSVILEALRQCPAGAWVGLETFSRYMQASGLNFSVTRDPWTLYIGEMGYGSLGHDGFHDWHILQQRFLGVLLMEYAATLGLIDLAYIDPWETAKDYSSLWGTDDLDFLSRYDGLLYFRLNALGAWCLGLADAYRPSQPPPRCRLSILPSLLVTVASGTLAAEEVLCLDTWAEPLDDQTWRLESGRILEALEQGRPLREFRDFLEAREDQGLPDTVEGFLARAEKRAASLRTVGLYLLIDCADEDLAEQLATGKDTKSLCLRAGPRRIAIKPENEDRFRRAVRGMGYGLPKA